MSKDFNIGLMADAELFGFPAQLGVAYIGGKTAVAGSLRTQGRQPADLLAGGDAALAELAGRVSVLPRSAADFSVDFAGMGGDLVLVMRASGVVCGMVMTDAARQLLLVLEARKLREGTAFERFVAGVADWMGMDSLMLVVRDRTDAAGCALLGKVAPDFGGNLLPKGFEACQLIAAATFGMDRSDFGRCVRRLTGLKDLQFAAGGSFTDAGFRAQLSCGRVETEGFIMEGLAFAVQKSAAGFFCGVSGTFIFKLEGQRLGFTLSGAVSNASFMLSAASLPETRIPLNSRLSFSDLGLSIGVTPTGLSMGMTGRLNTNNLTIFGGFMLSPVPPKITLLTAALSSVTGRISLRDLVVEIADIDWQVVDCLDVVAIGDFDLQRTALPQGIGDFPTDSAAEDFDARRTEVENRVVADFNRAVDDTLRIAGRGQLTPLGNGTGQFILTDKGTMRHYRIDRTGGISLNCQLYVCTEPVRLGNYDMPAGFFIAGVLEIFGKKARFLFLVDKGRSLVALVQLDRIDLFGLFVISRSQNSLPMEPVEGGLAGQLVKSDGEGPVLYLNIQRDKGELTFYVSAHISILKIFMFDSLILIRERFVYINIEYSLYGFKIQLYLKGAYQGFADSGFELCVKFDTSGFLEIMKKAQESLKKAAQEVKQGGENAVRELDEAQRKVNSLQRQIDDFDRRIEECTRIISDTPWYKPWIVVAYSAEIAGLAIARTGVVVAIGVANAALEVAKAAVRLGGAAVGSVLNSLAKVISAVTQVFWIKSFELGMTVMPDVKQIHAALVFVVFGKEVKLEKDLNLDGLFDNIKAFVSSGADAQSKALVEDLKNGKRALSGPDGEVQPLAAALADIRSSRELYDSMAGLREKMEALFVDANEVYFDAYNEEDPNVRESACRITGVRWEEECFRAQQEDLYDDGFVEALEQVTGYVRSDEHVDRAEVSDEMNRRMDDLLDLVHMLNADGKRRAQRAAGASLFERIDRNMEARRRSMRSRAAVAEVSADEANEQYAMQLTELVNRYLGDEQGEVADGIKRTLGVALYRFRNPEDTFSKY